MLMSETTALLPLFMHNTFVCVCMDSRGFNYVSAWSSIFLIHSIQSTFNVPEAFAYVSLGFFFFLKTIHYHFPLKWTSYTANSQC